MQLSFVLEGILCQSLLPKAGGKGRAMAMEILVPNAAIRNLIREDKVHQIYGMMQAGQAKYGMQTFNQSLAALYFKRHDHPADRAGPLVATRTSCRRSSPAGPRGPEPSAIGGACRTAEGAEPMPSSMERRYPQPASTQEGMLLADNRDAAIAVLRRQQIQVTNIREKGREIRSSRASRARSAPSGSPSSPASSR